MTYDSDPAVASDRCAKSPPSSKPALRIRSSRTIKLDRKSDELDVQSALGLKPHSQQPTCTHHHPCKVLGGLEDVMRRQTMQSRSDENDRVMN